MKFGNYRFCLLAFRMVLIYYFIYTEILFMHQCDCIITNIRNLMEFENSIGIDIFTVKWENIYVILKKIRSFSSR